ncbi:alkaline D-peptidase [Xylogone sp. PMI_703]|nr:alkaline D-peptidase [Xylogone sp. PMI_703]
MYITTYLAPLSCIFSATLATFTPCPILGPDYPKPPISSIPSSTIIQDGISNLRTLLDQTINPNNSTHGPTTPNTTSFSIALFTTSDGLRPSGKPFFFQYHHTAPLLDKKGGVDENSIYRIGELSQVFTVWTLLLEAGESYWNEPVTKYVPELAKAAKEQAAKNDPLKWVDWDDITVGDLAGHMAGIGREYSLEDLAFQNRAVSSLRLPNFNQSNLPPCGPKRACSREEFFAGFTHRNPVYLPSSTPIFSNSAFRILGYVIENITGDSFESVLTRNIFLPLNMTHSSTSKAPMISHGVIPGNQSASGWDLDLGDEAPALGIYSTITDLSRAGSSILGSSLLSPSLTRRWLKPISLTSNSANSVGRPWEIFSQQIGTNLILPVYTKLGTIGYYSSYLGVLPDYDIGFAILAADSTGAPDLNAHADIIGDAMVPALIKNAASSTAQLYAGTYQGTDNSSITLTVDDQPGISVDVLVSNGSDIRAAIAALSNIEPSGLSFRLFPTNLESKTPAGGRIAFRAVFQDENAFADAGTATCISWMSVDELVYGGIALDEFIFELDASGKAVMVEGTGLRVAFKR